jgi:predicted nucleic acid-binding protein
MNDKEFVDTNVLIYALDRSAGRKRTIALELLERLWEDRRGCVSLQVLQEFYATATKKLGMPPADAARQVERLGAWTVHRPSLQDLLAAIELHRRRQVPFWDALILRSAIGLGCSTLWTEDFSDGQKWDLVTVRNPFIAPQPG